MKKYIIIILSFFLFLVPRETFAESYTNGWVDKWCNDSSLTSCATYTYGWFPFNLSVNKNSSFVKDVYIGGVSYTQGSYYEVRFPFKIEVYDSHLTDGNYFQYFNSNGIETEPYLTLFQQGYGVQFRLFNGTSATICKVESFSTTNNIGSGSLVCPLLANSSNISRLRILLDNIESTGNPSTDGFGIHLYLGGDFTYSISDSSSIVESQNATTNALTNSSTNNNGISGATSNIENMIPQDTKSNNYYSNVFSFFSKVNDSINTTCNQYSLSLMGQTINFPCVNMANIFGDWWGIIDILCCIWPIINIFNLIIGWVDAITDLEDLSYFKQAKHIHWSREDYRKGLYY